MSIFVIINGKKTIPLSIYVKIISFLLLVTVSAFAMMPIQDAVSRVMYSIRNDFIQKIEDITGIEVFYSSIRPTIFGSFDIRNLRFMNSENTLFTVSRIRVNFSIFQLIIQKKAFINTIQVDNPLFDIDTSRDKETLEFFASLSKNRNGETAGTNGVTFSKILEILPRNALYQIRNGSMNFSGKDLRVKIDEVNLNIREEENEFFLDGNITAEAAYSGFKDKTLLIKTQIGVNGLSSQEIFGSAGSVSFSRIMFSEIEKADLNSFYFMNEKAVNPKPLFSVHPFNITLSYRNNELSSSKTDTADFFAYNFRFNSERNFIFADVNFNEFSLGDIIDIDSDFNYASHLMNIDINGQVSFSLDRLLNKMTYKTDINGGKIDSVTRNSDLIDAFKINLSGDETKIEIADFHIAASEETARLGFFRGNIGASGNVIFSPLQSYGSIFIDRFGFTSSESISAEFDVSTIMKEVSIKSPEVKIAGAIFNDFNALIFPAEKEIAVNISCFNDDKGSVYFDAVYNQQPRQAEASLSLDAISFFDITEIIRPFTGIEAIPFLSRSMLRDSLLKADFFFSTDFNNILFNAPNIAFNIADSSGSFSLSGTDKQFNLTNGLINIKDSDLNLSANVQYADTNDLNFALNVSYHDFAWNVEGQLLDKTTLIIHDPNGLNIYANVSNQGAMSGYIDSVNFPIPYKSQSIYINSNTVGRFDSRDSWNIDIGHLFALYEGEELFNFKGFADQNGANLSNITLKDSLGVLSGNADFTWNSSFKDIGFLVNISDLHDSKENFNFQGRVNDKKINARASVDDMRINRFTGSSSLMILNADAEVIWDSFNSFNADLNINSFFVDVNNTPMFASAGISLSDEEIKIQDFDLKFQRINAAMPQLLFNRSEGIVKTEISLEGIARDKNIEGQIELDAGFKSIESWLEIKNILNKLDGTLKVEDIVFGRFTSDEAVFNFSADSGDIFLSGGIDNMLRLEMDRDGNFFLGLSAPLPIHGSVGGTLKKGILDARVNNFFIDLESLVGAFTLTDDFVIAGGYITGEMEFKGSVLNPGFYGQGRANSMRFSVKNFVSEDIKAVPFIIHANGSEMYFEDVTLASGAGSGKANGYLHFLNWNPATIILEMEFPRATPILYDFNIAGFLARGTAAGDLGMNIDLRNKNMEINGDLFTNSSELGLSMDSLFAGNEPITEVAEGAMDVVVDITVTTGTMVEFVWPSSNPIIRANPELGSVINVSTDTRSGNFSLDSNIKLRSGELYYFDRNFFIRQGNIVFNENENKFDPIISARAETRDRSDIGNVTISMIVENQPLLSFEPRFESVPSISQLEIYTILGQNFKSTAGSDSNDSAQRFLISSTTDILGQVVAGSDTLSQLMFFRQFEKRMRNVLPFDMFSIKTRFIQNAVVSGVSGINQEAHIYRNSGIGNYFDNTTVFIGKYIGRDMFVQGMLTLKYDKNSNRMGGLVFEPDIGIELQSPYFNIRWDFFPYNPQNLWVSDNSITISWSKSF